MKFFFNTVKEENMWIHLQFIEFDNIIIRSE